MSWRQRIPRISPVGSPLYLGSHYAAKAEDENAAATRLHQAILRHSNIAVTQSCYIKALTESQVSAMDLVGEEFDNSSIN